MTNSHSFSVFVGIKPANRVWCINTGGKLCYDIEYTVERTIAPQAKNFETYTACYGDFCSKNAVESIKTHNKTSGKSLMHTKNKFSP